MTDQAAKHPRIYAAFLGLIAVLLIYGGFQLAWVGGSPYYLAAGLALLTSAALLFRGKREGIWVYAAIVVATLAWAVWEVGFAPWALMPRLAAWFIVGSWMLMPKFRRLPASKSGLLARLVPIDGMRGFATAIAIALLIGGGLNALRSPRIDPRFQTGTTSFPVFSKTAPTENNGEWRHWGGDAAGTRFAALSQITPDNVHQLKPAWQASITIDGLVGEAGNEAVPLMVSGTLYTCNGVNDVFAIDGETGKLVWQVRLAGKRGFKCRGVTYFETGEDGQCSKRILTATVVSTLVALDARTGQKCEGFGKNGVVDLAVHMPFAPKGYYSVTSAPTLIKGKVIVGGKIQDGQFWGASSGVIRAFDAITGQLAWAWDMGAPDRIGEPAEGETFTPGTPNSWAPMSADEQLGLVYVPMGNTSGVDYFSGLRRPFDNRFGSSVVALDVDTGRPRWSFQLVHNDVWDYDVASQPVLTDLPRPDGGFDRALIQGTKQGEIFVLDRVTGEPLRKVVEESVPQGGTVPGERLSPTQPYSVEMPSFRGPDLIERDMWGITPLDQMACRITFKRARYRGHFTPPGLQHWITFPGTTGGLNWGSPTIDRDRGVMIVTNGRIAQYSRLLRRSEADAMGYKPTGDWDQTVYGAGGGPQKGAPYGVEVNFLLSPLFAPCQAPPYGNVSAIDLRSGKLIWSRSMGSARDTGVLGMASQLPVHLGTPMTGGTLVTRSGLVFIAATMDRTLRALDIRSGKVLWQAELPHGGFSTPMTYLSPTSGRQFVVISTGSLYTLGGPKGAKLVAFAMPSAK